MKLAVFIKDPFVHFTLAGLLMFALSDFVDGNKSESRTIIIPKAEKEQLAGRFRASNGREPTENEWTRLMQDRIRDEVLVREAIAWNLHYNDPIVRRRLIQKMRFLFSGYAGETVSTGDLNSYFMKNSEAYRIEPSFAFRQVFISFDTHGETAGQMANEKFEQIQRGEIVTGDYWYLGSSELLQTESAIKSNYGDSFAESLSQLPRGQWAGPIESAFGLHLVLIENHVPASIPSFESIAPKVWVDFQKEREQQAFDEFVIDTLGQYTVLEPNKPDDG